MHFSPREFAEEQSLSGRVYPLLFTALSFSFMLPTPLCSFSTKKYFLPRGIVRMQPPAYLVAGILSKALFSGECSIPPSRSDTLEYNVNF